MTEKNIKVGDVVSPKGDKYFYMTVVRVMKNDEVQCDYPGADGGRERDTYPVAALIIHEDIGNEDE